MILSLNRENRKFHDAWAFVLFIITILSCCPLLFIFSETKDYFSFLSYLPLSLISVFLVGSLLQFFILLICLLYFPGPLMHASFFILPVLQFLNRCFTHGLIENLIYLVVMFSIFMYIYFKLFKKHIKYTAIICKKASEKVRVSLFVLLAYSLILTVMISIFSFFISQAVGGLLLSDSYSVLKKCFICLGALWVCFWALYNTVYAVRVLFSTIIFCRTLQGNSVEVETKKESNEPEQQNQRVLTNYTVNMVALRNTLFALGSICFGGLIIGIITALLRFLICKPSNRSDRSAVDVCCCSFFFILAELVHFCNKWTFE